jgi:hypothetical protein
MTRHAWKAPRQSAERGEATVVIGSFQCFLVFLVITAFIGFARGWMREIITMAIIMGAVLFLLNGGDGLLHQFFFVNLPNAFHDLFFGTSAVAAGTPTVSTPNPTEDYLFGFASFLGLMGLGYGVGHKFGAPATTSAHRLTGVLPGTVSGASMAYYASNTILPNTTLDLSSPSGVITRLYLPVILGLGLLGLVVILLISRAGKGGGAKKGH